MELIKNLNWRYATKKFDPDKKVSPEDLEVLKRAIQLSVSSYGLQLYKVLVVEDLYVRNLLRPASWNQSQITDASHLFVFCNYTDVYPGHIDQYINLTAKRRQLSSGELKAYSNFMKMKIAEKSEEERFYWTKHQTYIALANLLSISAELKIDACPMEGFEPDKYDEILGLSQKGLHASVIAAVGYRDKEDQTQNDPKVRKPLELLFENI